MKASMKQPGRSAFAAALITLGSCGAGNDSSNQTNGASTVEHAKLAELSLTSGAFQNGQPIPTEYSCDGTNKSPPLQWGEPPARTKSLALVIDDPDAPGGTFRHWGAYDIPASTRSIASGERVGTEVDNDGGKPGYTGPCPAKGNGVHHYHFKLLALGVEKLNLEQHAKVADVEAEASEHAIGRGDLIGTYERR